MKTLFCLLNTMLLLMATGRDIVYDPTNHTQSINNTNAITSQITINRQYLNQILTSNKELRAELQRIYTESQQIRKESEKIRDFSDKIVERLGSPETINTGLNNQPSTTFELDLTTTELRAKAKEMENPSLELYGDKIDPKLRYMATEAAYQNYEKVLKQNRSSLKRLLIKRTAVIEALEYVKTTSELQKLQFALEAMNTRINEFITQEESAYRKLSSQQIRNNEIEKYQERKSEENRRRSLSAIWGEVE